MSSKKLRKPFFLDLFHKQEVNLRTFHTIPLKNNFKYKPILHVQSNALFSFVLFFCISA